MWTLVGTRMPAFGSRGLGVSTFPWGRVTDTREKKSPLIILRPKGRGRISYPGSRGCEEGFGEEFESRVTRWNAWKGARVQRMRSGKDGRARRSSGERACASKRGTRGRARQRAATSALFTREHVLHPK
ncbi:hypothetical protein CRG98_007481 [Punica granatum]|uniref:Uncharacterized protein n=1 Tax=Punica granatum TaxID=22663 RepID=A0A2I0KUF6_PUNGR|nr:hypothetical protein CRG98_007481 [Punica granatum]